MHSMFIHWCARLLAPRMSSTLRHTTAAHAYISISIVEALEGPFENDHSLAFFHRNGYIFCFLSLSLTHSRISSFNLFLRS